MSKEDIIRNQMDELNVDGDIWTDGLDTTITLSDTVTVSQITKLCDRLKQLHYIVSVSRNSMDELQIIVQS